MFVACALVTVVAAAADPYAATNAFMRPTWLLATMTKLGVPESWITKLDLLKAAGAVGLLVGIGVPLVGTAATVGLILYFVAAILAHQIASRDSGVRTNGK
jgi:DoxX-like family